MVIIHIGKKIPKGYKEISAIHLGKGIWMFSMEPVKKENEVRKCIHEKSSIYDICKYCGLKWLKKWEKD